MKKLTEIFYKVSIGIIVFWIILIIAALQIKLDEDNALIRAGSDSVFPLETTKNDVLKGSAYKGQKLIWKTDTNTSYHHSYKAADIHVQPGTSVLAAKGGVVVEVNNTDYCDVSTFPYIVIQGDDNFYYLYSHLQENSVLVDVNQRISAGEMLGSLGDSNCAQNTAPHLHFEIYRYRWSRNNAFTRDWLMIDPQSILVNSYQDLPQ